jgi:SET domain-containing protein
MKQKKGFRQPKQPTRKQREKKWAEAIDLLNTTAKFKIAPSTIHGVGVFALRDIKEGEVLQLDAIPHAFDIPYDKFNELREEIADLILGQHPQVVNGSHFIYPTTRFLTYVNHSEDANYDAIKDIALKDIKEGEEITEDYRKINGFDKVFKWLV